MITTSLPQDQFKKRRVSELLWGNVKPTSCSPKFRPRPHLNKTHELINKRIMHIDRPNSRRMLYMSLPVKTLVMTPNQSGMNTLERVSHETQHMSLESPMSLSDPKSHSVVCTNVLMDGMLPGLRRLHRQGSNMEACTTKRYSVKTTLSTLDHTPNLGFQPNSSLV